jgi:NAD(P)-dependent dehydrogenase (short-subunit alcohol dehydrogenase family)
LRRELDGPRDEAAEIFDARTAALTYGPGGIRVNAICPGAVLTELTTRVWDLADDPSRARREMEALYPLRRIALPAEIASIAVFLASNEASAITGAMIVADCGLTAANAEYSLFAQEVV